MIRKVNYFFDTEFIETPEQLLPISIGMVCEDGRELHLVSNAYDWHSYPGVHPWVRKNVIEKLPPPKTWETPEAIALKLKAFVDAPNHFDKEYTTRPQFWAYFASYDWVCLCWFMGGRMVDIPTGWPHHVMDLKQSMVERGMMETFLPDKNKKLQHNALEDARWLKRAHEAVFG